MNWLRTRLRRWLGIHDDTTVRRAILAEMDADRVWLEMPTDDPALALHRRHTIAEQRQMAIRLGYREEPGV